MNKLLRFLRNAWSPETPKFDDHIATRKLIGLLVSLQVKVINVEQADPNFFPIQSPMQIEGFCIRMKHGKT